MDLNTSHSRIYVAALGAMVVTAIGVGTFLGVRGASGSPHEWTPEIAAVPEWSGDDARSLCGLPGVADSGTATAAPRAEWRYQGTTAYPISRVHGPGRTAPEGFRYCFQHTPEGAIFAAANAIVQGSDGEAVAEWVDYAAADGPHREAVLAHDGTPSDQSDSRSKILGFRMLEYSGSAALVDIAVRFSKPGGTIVASAVYDLVWAEGDWKLSTASLKPLSVAVIPDLAGYVPWGEEWSGDA